MVSKIDKLKILDFLKSEALRVDISKKFVVQMNRFSTQKAGGCAIAPIIPSAIGKTNSCFMCVTRGTCLGKSCLGDNGMYL